jgi:hypothetical protein
MLSPYTMNANHTDNYDASQRELAAGVLKEVEQDVRRFHEQPAQSNENFRPPPLLLVFPGDQRDKYRRSRPQISTW